MTERDKKRLLQLHEEENELNREMGGINKQITLLRTQKLKLQRRISANMKFRNRILFPEKP